MKKVLPAITICLSILILISCEEEAVTTDSEEGPEQKAVDSEEQKITSEQITFSMEHPDTGQPYEIVHAYKLFENYQKEMEEHPEVSSSYQYKQEVINPIYNKCFNGEYYFGSDSIEHKEPEDFEQIEKIIQQIERTEINGLIKEALVKSSNHLPTNEKTTVCVFPSTNPNAYSGVTVGAGKIIINYNKFYNEELLQTVTAHEYHHSLWTEKYFTENSPQTILSNIVFEGKAVMFEKLIYPDSASTTTTNYGYNNDYWSKIEPDLYKTDFNRSQEILFGGENLPANYGYSEGFKMVKSYLDSHPDVTPEEWTALSAKEIYEEGNYADHYR